MPWFPQFSTVHLAKFLIGHFFIISDQALITLELFLLRYVRFNGQKFSGLPEKLSLNPRFFVKNAKICLFEEKRFE